MMTLRTFNTIMPRIAASAYIDPHALVIGDVHVGAEASVWPMAGIRGDVNRIVVGAATNIQDHVVLHATHDGPFTPGGTALTIGQGVTVGHRAVLHACHTGDYCLIGIGAIILDGAVLGDRVMVGAGALVPPGKTLDSGYLYTGIPAVRRRALTGQELRLLEYSAQHYTTLARCHRDGNPA